MEPLISVIVPVYNVSHYLDECVESIVAQSYTNLEILLIDDGSTDESGALCDLWQEKDRRIRSFHKPNGGLSDARNFGLRHMRGDYFAFVDSDDYMDVHMIARLYEACQKERTDLSICFFQKVDEMGQPLGMSSYSFPKQPVVSGAEILRNLQMTFYVTAWNRLYRTSTFGDLRFPIGKIHEDEFVAHEVYVRVALVALVDERLYFYRQRAGSIMSRRGLPSILNAGEAFSLRGDFFAEREDFMLATRWYSGALFMWGKASEHTSLQMHVVFDKLDRLCQERKVRLSINTRIVLFLMRGLLSPYRFVRIGAKRGLELRSTVGRGVVRIKKKVF